MRRYELIQKVHFELMLILQPKVAEKEEKHVLNLIKKHIDKSGKIIKEEKQGKKQFAYPIKKKKEGVYFLLTLEVDGKEIESLTKKLNLEQFVLRHLFIRKE